MARSRGKQTMPRKGSVKFVRPPGSVVKRKLQNENSRVSLVFAVQSTKGTTTSTKGSGGVGGPHPA